MIFIVIAIVHESMDSYHLLAVRISYLIVIVYTTAGLPCAAHSQLISTIATFTRRRVRMWRCIESVILISFLPVPAAIYLLLCQEMYRDAGR